MVDKALHAIIISLEYPPIQGGGGTYTYNLTRNLAKLGVQVTLCTSGEIDSVENPLKNLTVKRYKVLYNLYKEQTGVLNAVDIILSLIRELKPDVLHSQYMHETLVTAIANKNFELPHFVTFHKTPLYRSESLTKNSTWTLFDFLLTCNAFTKYICPSNAFRNGLIQQGLALEKSLVIYPGIDQNTFERVKNRSMLNRIKRKIGLKKGDKLILIPCLPRKRKGLEFCIEALNQINDTSIKVLVTGLPQVAIESEIMVALKNKAREGLLLEQKYFEYNEMPLLYSVADLAILTSEAEGLGLSLLEAMSCDCPVIGTNVIGINEVIVHGKNGLLIDYGDHQGLIQSINKLITDKDLREKVIRNGRQTLVSKFSLVHQAKEHLKRYTEASQVNSLQIPFILFKSINSDLKLLVSDNKGSYRLPLVSRTQGKSTIESITSFVGGKFKCELVTPSLSFYSDFFVDRDLVVKQTLSYKPIIYAFDLTHKTLSEETEGGYVWMGLDQVKSKSDESTFKLIDHWELLYQKIKS